MGPMNAKTEYGTDPRTAENDSRIREGRRPQPVELFTTGIAGLDDILSGGLARNHLYLIEGDPGTGKTTIAMQFLMEGARCGQKGLYVTLSESRSELLEIADSHGWSLDQIDLFELVADEEQLKPETQYTVFSPSEIELADTTNAVLAEVKNHFRPEFINRIDEVVVFHALNEADIKSIAKIQLQYLAKRLAAMEMRIDVSEAALAEIAAAGFDPVYGARPLKRAIQAQIENPLAKEILSGQFAAKDTIRVDARGGHMVFSKGKVAQAA